jgi:hypothetical protein
MMWWRLTWKMGLAVVVAIMCLQFAIENAKTARGAYQTWQTTRAASDQIAKSQAPWRSPLQGAS